MLLSPVLLENLDGSQLSKAGWFCDTWMGQRDSRRWKVLSESLIQVYPQGAISFVDENQIVE